MVINDFIWKTRGGGGDFNYSLSWSVHRAQYNNEYILAYSNEGQKLNGEKMIIKKALGE